MAFVDELPTGRDEGRASKAGRGMNSPGQVEAEAAAGVRETHWDCPQGTFLCFETACLPLPVFYVLSWA